MPLFKMFPGSGGEELNSLMSLRDDRIVGGEVIDYPEAGIAAALDSDNIL